MCVRACDFRWGVVRINFVYFINKLCGVVWRGSETPKRTLCYFHFRNPRPRSTQVATLVWRGFPFQPSPLRAVRRTIQFSLFINFLPILGASKRRFVIKFGKPPVEHKSELNNEEEAS